MSELATAVFAAQSGSHLLDAPRTARFSAFLRSFDEGSYLADLARRGFRWVPRADPAFPARLRSVHDPPPGLFIRGEVPLGLLGQPSVALVGARACSGYGSDVAASLGRDLAAAGVVVVSGLARGIDAAAHRGALETGLTVAVLGCGVDRDYPRAHASLAARIAAAGLIVSEYPPGRRAGPVAVPGAQPARRRSRARHGGRRGTRAERRTDHRRLRPRRGARGPHRPRGDHVAALEGDECAASSRRDSGHLRGRCARCDRRRAAACTRAACARRRGRPGSRGRCRRARCGRRVRFAAPALLPVSSRRPSPSWSCSASLRRQTACIGR